MVAQILGAACASLVVYANYKSAIDVYEGMFNTLGLSFTTSHLSANSPHQAAPASAQSHPPQTPPPVYSARILNPS